jgi:hypothetical protein
MAQNDHDLVHEASDPTTSPEQLRKLARSKVEQIRQAAWKNPSLPEDVWWSFLENPETWDNPMATLYLFLGNHPDPSMTKIYRAMQAIFKLMKDPLRASEEAKLLMDSILMEWWNSTPSPYHMLHYLSNWASFQRVCGERHRIVVGVLRVILQKHWQEGMVKEKKALYAMDDFSKGNCNRKNLQQLSQEKFPTFYSEAIQYMLDHTTDASYSIRELIAELAAQREEHGEPYAESERRYMEDFANLIRSEIPNPPLASDQRP